jgi:hypothetical protein
MPAAPTVQFFPPAGTCSCLKRRNIGLESGRESISPFPRDAKWQVCSVRERDFQLSIERSRSSHGDSL